MFDWYALSLANIVLAWRKGSTDMISTFVHSAQRVSGIVVLLAFLVRVIRDDDCCVNVSAGTTERTDVNAPVGHGIGTKGYQLVRDRRGNMRWAQMWSYSFLEDYQKALINLTVFL